MIFDEFDDMMARAFRPSLKLLDDTFFDMDRVFRDIGKKKGKSYSISYRYETGMKEPEIKVEGDVDQKTIDHFIENVKHDFGTDILGKGTPKVEQLGSGEEKPASKTIELELPGFGKNDLKVEVKGKRAIITGEKNGRKINEKINLGFKPTEHSVTAEEGLFKLEFHRKIEEQNEIAPIVSSLENAAQESPAAENKVEK